MSSREQIEISKLRFEVERLKRNSAGLSAPIDRSAMAAGSAFNIVYNDAAGYLTQSIGSNGQALVMAGGVPTWQLLSTATGSGGLTRIPVSSTTVITSSSNIYIGITDSFSGTIVLPPATTQAQMIVIVDEAGIGGGDIISGSTSNLINITCSAGNTVNCDTIVGSQTRLLLWAAYGKISLISDGSSSWKAVERKYWHVDPRQFSPIIWLDGRRGITLATTAAAANISVWADLSGQGNDVSQGTTANQPKFYGAGAGYRLLSVDQPYVRFESTAQTISSSAALTFNTSGAVMLAAHENDFEAKSDGMLFRTNWTAGAGLSYYPAKLTALGGLCGAGDCFISGQGSNIATSVGPFIAARADYNYGVKRSISTLSVAASSYRTPNGEGVVRRTGRVFRSALTAGSGGPFTTFSQAVILGSSWIGSIFQFMLWNGTQNNDVYINIENAIAEVWPGSG